jgi:hypothetical protein
VDSRETLGDLLFGRKLRLRVLLWASEQDREFHQSQAAHGVNYSSTGEVAKELERLTQLGMLRKLGRTGRVGPQNYLRLAGHPGWEIARAAVETMAFMEVEDSEDGELAQLRQIPTGGQSRLRSGRT